MIRSDQRIGTQRPPVADKIYRLHKEILEVTADLREQVAKNEAARPEQVERLFEIANRAKILSFSLKV